MKITQIAQLIHVIRGQRVILDKDLAVLYGVPTKILNKAVSRNIERFPADFMLTLTPQERQILRFQIGTLRWGSHTKYSPRAFTQEGVAMLSGILRSPAAIKVNIEIMRAFVRLRSALSADAGISGRMKSAEAAIAAHDRELTEHAVHINEAFAEIRRIAKP